MAETDTLEAPARRMLDRGHKALETVLRKTNSAGIGLLQSATNEVAFLMEAARLAVNHQGDSTDAPGKQLQDARLRGLARIAELRKEAEPCLETGQVCELLGVTRETIRKKVDRKQLLALPKGGERVFPAFQFKDGNVVPGLGEVLEALDTDSIFVRLAFLLSKSPLLGNRTAIEELQAGKLENVILEARSLFRHGG
jgi:hypothetical protein